jgi:hypothetical protein
MELQLLVSSFPTMDVQSLANKRVKMILTKSRGKYCGLPLGPKSVSSSTARKKTTKDESYNGTSTSDGNKDPWISCVISGFITKHVTNDGKTKGA